MFTPQVKNIRIFKAKQYKKKYYLKIFVISFVFVGKNKILFHFK